MIQDRPFIPLSAILPERIAGPDIFLRDLTMHTDAIDAGTGQVFVALSGTRRHGLEFGEEALRRGAVAVLWDEASIENIPGDPRWIHVPSLRAHLLSMAIELYGRWPAKRPLIAVTGTDGKTSVSHQVSRCLEYLGEHCAVIGTLGIGHPDNLTPSTHTTPDLLGLHKALGSLSRQGFTAVALEASSHALDQGRLQGIEPRVAILTNLGHDHLDYHKTVEAYAAAKARLFSLSGLEAVVLNRDDALGQSLISRISSEMSAVTCWTYGSEKCQSQDKQSISASDIDPTPHGLRFTLSLQQWESTITVPLIGEFQVANLQAVFACLLSLGHAPETASTALSHVRGVPGRMEPFVTGDGVTLVVDYAHTPQALASSLHAVRRHVGSGRLYCIFGCGGDRDVRKRPLMGKLAAELADVVVITDDNPRSEPQKQIRLQILTGCRQVAAPGQIREIGDRTEAIRTIFSEAEPGDMILIAGKGHETQQILADGPHPFSDRELAIELTKCSSHAVGERP